MAPLWSTGELVPSPPAQRVLLCLVVVDESRCTLLETATRTAVVGGDKSRPR